jgi:hypothetical protein
VVQYAGGWLYDRMMAGWDVSVHVRELGDVRPLQILGATPLELEQSLGSSSHGPMPHAIAVSTSMFETDVRVREGMLAALDDADHEIRLWGDRLPTELGRRCAPTQHRLSVAARAFKSRAVAALGTGAPIDAFESFCGAAHAKFPSTADLVTAM